MNLALQITVIMSLALLGAKAQIPQEVLEAANERLDGLSGSGIIIAQINGADVKYTYINADDSRKPPIEPNSLIEIGSVSKTFTGILLAKLVFDGKIDYRKAVSEYLPDNLFIPGLGGKEITCYQLATHGSGLPRLPNNLVKRNPLNPYADYSCADMYDFLSSYVLPREPGEEYEYSHLGFGLLTSALEHVSSRSYEDLVVKEICKHLGMNNTYITLKEGSTNPRAIPFNGLLQANYWDYLALTGSGALKSTMEDMTRFVQAHMGITKHPLQDAMDLASTGQYPSRTPFTSVGFGWHVKELPTKNIAWHNGASGGFRCMVAFDAKDQKAVIMAVNNSDVDVMDLTFRLLDDTQKVKRIPRPDNITHELLMNYSGTYRFHENFEMEISVEGTRIYAQATEQKQFEIYPESETVFAYRVTLATIEFYSDKGGKVQGLVLRQNQQNFDGLKIR
jgi:serine-type D-Ala-D-Ala carboxypeptidase/endopeptidase